MSSKNTYTASDVRRLLDSILESLAENQLVVQQVEQEKDLDKESKVFALGQASGLETAEALIEETKEEV